jgi:cell division protein FtsL
MKCDMTNSILTFVLGVLVVLGAILTVQTINHTRELNQLSAENLAINQNYARLQALNNEVVAYDQKYPNPALTHILQGH